MIMLHVITIKALLQLSLKLKYTARSVAFYQRLKLKIICT